MSPSQLKALSKRLDALYREVPSANCKGLCHTTCGPVPRTEVEQKRMTKSAGKSLPIVKLDTLECSHLDEAGERCTIYSVRPMICRLWGVAEGMVCIYGCTPDRILSAAETTVLIQKSIIIGRPCELLTGDGIATAVENQQTKSNL